MTRPGAGRREPCVARGARGCSPAARAAALARAHGRRRPPLLPDLARRARARRARPRGLLASLRAPACRSRGARGRRASRSRARRSRRCSRIRSPIRFCSAPPAAPRRARRSPRSPVSRRFVSPGRGVRGRGRVLRRRRRARAARRPARPAAAAARRSHRQRLLLGAPPRASSRSRPGEAARTMLFWMMGSLADATPGKVARARSLRGRRRAPCCSRFGFAPESLRRRRGERRGARRRRRDAPSASSSSPRRS